MRRISVLFALAVLLLATVVAFTYRERLARDRAHASGPAPNIRKGYEAVANGGWVYDKTDPRTNKRIVHATAKSFQATDDPSTFELHDLTLRLYDKDAGSYTFVRSGDALFDDGSGLMKSKGTVTIIMNVPADKNAEEPQQVANLVQVDTSGVAYETKSGKADTDQPASFRFSDGGGHAVGLSYDPTTGALHLKSQVSLDWVGDGPAENKMHVEAGDAVYNEREQKVYLSPWSKLQRQTTTINALNSVVTLDKGVLQKIDSDHAAGSDVREEKKTDYAADKMTALFDDNGAIVNIVGEGNARVTTTESGSRTNLTGNRADLRFAVVTKEAEGEPRSESNLHLVLADGRAVAESDPLPLPGKQPGESHLLRSEHIELEMKPDGKDVQEIRAPDRAQLEFKPNGPDQSHRILDASRLRILYGEGSYIDTFVAWNASTHTDKPASIESVKLAKNSKPAPPVLTWSDQLTAKFTPNSNQVATIDQTGNFRYQEGSRKANARRALLEQGINRITLLGGAHVSDDSGSAASDKIVMNQANGDMDAFGHVVSTHAPDKNQKPGTSMLDKTQTMQAKADQMETREDNGKVFYEGHAVMWQGANRISAEIIHIDRDAQTLMAQGNVISELVDNRAADEPPKNPPGAKGLPPSATPAPVYTVVYAPELSYRDDTRVAAYSGGVRLERAKMTVRSHHLDAFLTPKTQTDSDDSSLDHAYAEGGVTVMSMLASGRSRTGSSERGEYYTKEDKVVLKGGSPQMLDSYKGITKGHQLTYFSADDRLIVEGEKKDLAYTQMKKK